MMSLLDKSYRMVEWEMCPFYVNKVASLHGGRRHVFVNPNSGIHFVCAKYRDGEYKVITTVGDFDPRTVRGK